MIQKSILFIFTCICFYPTIISASSIINTEDHPSAQIEMCELVADHQATREEIKDLKRDEKRMLRFEKVMVRMNKKAASGSSGHAAGLFNDPVNRWFWLWIITWGVGIFLLVVSAGALTSAAIGIIWLLAFAIGSVSLILWLVKKFG